MFMCVCESVHADVRVCMCVHMHVSVSELMRGRNEYKKSTLIGEFGLGLAGSTLLFHGGITSLSPVKLWSSFQLGVQKDSNVYVSLEPRQSVTVSMNPNSLHRN